VLPAQSDDAAQKIVESLSGRLSIADRLTAPTVLEEHRSSPCLPASGAVVKEMVYPSRWTDGGRATAHVKSRIDLNGFYLIQDAVRGR